MSSSRLMAMRELAMQGNEELTFDVGDDLVDDPVNVAGAGGLEAQQTGRTSPVASPDRSRALRVSPVNTVQAGGSQDQPAEIRGRKSGEAGARGGHIPSEKRRRSSHESDPRKESKKSKHRNKTPPVRAVPLDEEFLKQSYQEWRADPVAASARVFLELSEVHKIEKAKCERQAQEQIDLIKQQKLEVDQELASKTTALSKANHALERLRQERVDLEKSKDANFKRAADAEKKVESLGERLRQLEALEAAAQERVKTLETRISELENKQTNAPAGSSDSVADLQKKNAALQAQLSKLQAAYKTTRAQAKKAADDAILLYEDGFKEALRQVALTQPALAVDPAVVNPANQVEEDRIVFVDPVTKETATIFPSSNV